MDILRKISDCIVDMGKEEIKGLVQEAIDTKLDVEEIYRKGLNNGMTRALDKFEEKEYYLPEIIVCADTLN
ncbi:B12-binding domain-containing protein, partial [Terrisporobacter sp.]|uniref:B12-binding domain-containing protein n=1 Tax=Terrisporobacter sp. TaxID=1965305 RepID=UPI0028A02456